MRYTCEYGHLKGGKPEVHPSRRYCDRWVAAHSQPAPAPPAAAPAPGSPPAGATAEKPSATTPGSGGPKLEGGGFSVGYGPATRVGEGFLAANVNLAWELTQDQSERFFTAIWGVLNTIANGICKLLKIKEVPPDVFEIDPGQKFLFRGPLRGWATHHIQTVWRAKTPEDADKVISTIGGISAFGMMGIKLVWHFVQEVPKSPYWAKFQERRKAWIAARMGRFRGGEPEPSPAAGGAPPIANLPAPPRAGATA
jgi:hypothetical protein